MKDQDLAALPKGRFMELELPLTPRGVSPGSTEARSGGSRPLGQPTTELAQLKIVVHVAPAEAPTAEGQKPLTESPAAYSDVNAG